MSFDVNSSLVRSDETAWKQVASGDNGVDLVQCTLQAASIGQAAAIAAEILELLADAELVDSSTKDTEVSVRAWRVDVIMSTPRGAWRSVSQKALAGHIAARFN